MCNYMVFSAKEELSQKWSLCWLGNNFLCWLGYGASSDAWTLLKSSPWRRCPNQVQYGEEDLNSAEYQGMSKSWFLINSGKFLCTYHNFNGLSRTAQNEAENVLDMDRKLLESSFQINWNHLNIYFLQGVMTKSSDRGHWAELRITSET